MAKKLYRITVTGRVQGVGFRRYVEKEARFTGLRGFVKNLPDGKVYIEAEGDEEKLDMFLGWVTRSPGFSYVESVSVETGPLAGYNGFSIKY